MRFPPPPLWLLVIIIGFPQFCETVYSPALTYIEHSFKVSASLCEYTLTLYLLAFAFGIMFWGFFSDQFGRRPCLIGGLIVLLFGCLGCYFSSNIYALLFSRFVQGFGAGSCSVMGQSMCRDLFQGTERVRIYSLIGSTLFISPTLGPIIGGMLIENKDWSFNFFFLFIMALILLLLCFLKVGETFLKRSENIPLSFFLFLKDKKVLAFCAISSGCNGIIFSYYSEGPFYMIESLKLSSSLYWQTCIFLAFGSGLGSMFSRYLSLKINSLKTIYTTLKIIVLVEAIFLLIPNKNVILVLFFMMLTCFCIGTMIPNVLAIALEDYRLHIGKASAYFGFLNYIIASILNFFIGFFHNGTLWLMPLYFLCICLFMFITFKTIIFSPHRKNSL